ncbi:MAG: hypothetical protein FJW24_09980 [Acidimicrobiia bacterium]|nr:hypothetical protein [Acidimicrobiia bacterium]
MNRILAAATALSLIVGAGGLAAPAAFAQATPATPAQKAEPAKKKSDAKKAKEKAKSGYGKAEPKK